MEFEKMGVLLMEEEQRLLQALRQEEEATATQLRESAAMMEQQSRSLETLLLQLEDRSMREPLHMLQVRYSLGQAGQEGALAQVCLACSDKYRTTGSVSVASGCLTNATAWGLR